MRLYIADVLKRKKTEDAGKATTCRTLKLIPEEPEGGFAFESFDKTINEINTTHNRVWDYLMSKQVEA